MFNAKNSIRVAVGKTKLDDFDFFSLFFVSGPCARLSWPSRQLLSARKSTVSYRIVSYRR